MMTCPLGCEERIMSIESLVRHLGVVEDPRCQGKIEHRLIDILVIAVCAVIACAESWDDIALYGRSKLAWLRTFLELPNGIPSHDTFRRVFMLIDPDAFERGFAAWVGSLVDGFEREVAAIDGKTLRRSFDRSRERSPLHLVSAWASEQGLVLGQRRVHEASNEITAIPELLDQLALENSIVTLDAMGCQTAIAEQILARGADYLLGLKASHPLGYQAFVKHFDQACFRRGAPQRAAWNTFDEAHGRLEPSLEFDGLFGRQGGGEPGVVPHIREQDGRSDPADLTPPDGAGQDRSVGLVTDVDAQHIVEVLMEGADLHHGRHGRHDKPQNPQALLAQALRGTGRERQAVVGAVREEDWHDEVVSVPRRLQVGDDVEPVVRRLREVEQQPFPGAVNVGEGALVVDPARLGPCGKRR